MRFTKMQGIGNDYLLINCFEEYVPDPSRLAVEMCREHVGVGADGIVLLEPGESSPCVFSIAMAARLKCAETPPAASENLCMSAA